MTLCFVTSSRDTNGGVVGVVVSVLFLCICCTMVVGFFSTGVGHEDGGLVSSRYR